MTKLFEQNPGVVVVIPARLESTRLPRKLLLRESGKTVLQHTYEAASQATIPSRVIVAADHLEIANEVSKFGGEVMMTDPAAACGTDRVAEVAQQLSGVDVVVNVQGDEPELAPESVDEVACMLIKDQLLKMATLACPIRSTEQLCDPACVKVVFDSMHRAMYFSRSPIPHCRETSGAYADSSGPLCFQHIGLYAYRKEFLIRLAKMPPSRLEQFECLEQLRVLESGIDIKVGLVERHATGIDTHGDYKQFIARRKSA